MAGVIDAREVTEPSEEVVIEVDHSAERAEMRNGGLRVSNMYVAFGGKQTTVPASTVTGRCIHRHEGVLVSGESEDATHRRDVKRRDVTGGSANGRWKSTGWGQEKNSSQRGAWHLP